MRTRFTRRRFLTISACAAGVGLLPFGAGSRAAARLVEWQGLSLGALATIRIQHGDEGVAQRILREVLAEARRLENILSLYRADSALRELNLRGVLVGPPPELADLLALCNRIWHSTGGMFDPTVQPLWQCYAEHFSTEGAPFEPPAPEKLQTALKLVGWPGVAFNRDRIVLERRGMALTLNGIAQGYITDRVVDLLRHRGIENCHVDMGEIRTLGGPDGKPWQVALQGPAATPLAKIDDTVNMAVATSGAAGFQFDQNGLYNHLFHPATGRCSNPARSITVVHASAAEADALSTAFSLMGDAEIVRVLGRGSGARVYATTVRETREIGVNKS